MNRKKALRKDLKSRFSDKIQEFVRQEDPAPSKKVKKLIQRTSKKLANAVARDSEKAMKRAEKIARKAEKRAAGKKKNKEGAKEKKDKAPIEMVA